MSSEKEETSSTEVALLEVPNGLLGCGARAYVAAAAKSTSRRLYIVLRHDFPEWAVATTLQPALVDLYSTSMFANVNLDVCVIPCGRDDSGCIDPCVRLQDVDVVLYTSGQERDWEPVNEARRKRGFRLLRCVPLVADEMGNDGSQSRIEDTIAEESFCQYDFVGIGGTYDHLHNGHKLLLTAAAALARKTLLIGVTTASMLQKKAYVEAMQSYETRVLGIENFLTAVKPALQLSIQPISDVYGPAHRLKDLQCMVVSEDSIHGGRIVNDKRAENGLQLLHLVCVPLVGPQEGVDAIKLSSTDLRRQELERRRKVKKE